MSDADKTEYDYSKDTPPAFLPPNEKKWALGPQKIFISP